MNSRFAEKHITLLKDIDPEIADFYMDWLRMRESNGFETTAHILAHLAREILRGLQDRVPKDVAKIYSSIIHLFDKFSHRREGGKAPRPKESFNQIWTEFESLLVYLVESPSDFYNTSDHCPFVILQNSLKQLETETSKSLETEWMIPDIELLPHQSEISQNLEKIAPLFAAFYRDWVRMLRATNFQCRSYMLAHLAREVDSGLRGALSTKRGQKQVQEQLKKVDLGDLKEHVGYIASIMEALGVPDFGLRVQQWIQTVKDLKNLTHRDLDDEAKLLRNEVESLWPKVEELWAYLVGSYLKLLNRVDRILGYKCEPPADEQIKEGLRNLLEFEGINQYFFDQLESPAWLKLLKEDGRLDPDQNPAPQEYPDQLGSFYTPTWHALEYVVKMAVHPDSPVDILVDIVNEIITSAGDYRNRINNKWTDWQTIKIIGALPTDQIRCGHITFMGITLKSKWRSGLVDQEISQEILPKLLDAGAKELTLILLKVMFDAKVIEEECDPEITEAAKESTLDLFRAMFGPESVNHEIIADVETYEPKGVNREITYMQEYWLTDALKEHGESIAKLCGVKAANIALEQIRTLIAESVTSFDRIQLVRTEPSDAPRESYAELLVEFVSRVLRFAEPTSITEMLEDLLQVTQTIIRRIALTAVTHHYSDLKQMFWEWKGNPLEKVSLKPELYQLIQTNCTEFKESEIEQILDWIELAQFTTVFAKDDETRRKAAAYKKREWLSALLEVGNEKVIAADKKYKQINPKPIEHPGLLRWTESGWGETSPMVVEDLLRMSNEQIAKYLNDFEETEAFRRSNPTERGLAQTLEKCVETNPQKFTDNLLPFQGVSGFYQSSLLHGFLTAWRDKEPFDWSVLLTFIRQILSSEQFWHVQYKVGFNYRNWILSTAADLITDGTKDDKHAFDVQLLPLVEEILLILVEKTEPSIFTPTDSSLDALSSDRGKAFSAMVNYALRFAHTNEANMKGCRWPQTVRDDFTKRLDRSVETSLEFFYTLGFYLPDLLYLDEQWVVGNIDCIFPQQNEDHWQAAFSGYLLSSRYPHTNLYVWLKANGHYRKALNTNFADKEVQDRLVSHLCVGWVKDWETFDDDTSLIYQLINSRNPNLLSAVVHFFLREGETLSQSNDSEKIKAYEKVKAKVRPAWRALFKVLSRNSDEVAYQQILSPLSAWLGLVDEIDTEILESVKASIKYIDKAPGYGMTLSRVIEALLRHVLITPQKVGKIYLAIPKSEMWYLQGVKKGDIEKTVRILYSKECKELADAICERFAKASVLFLRSVREEHQT